MKNFENRNEDNENVVEEKASDMEIAELLGRHIDNPCSVDTSEGVKDIRYFYIREAKKMLSKMTDEKARTFLDLKIKEYE